eukprot:9689464-Alexandrium_andersonii.AAC.1
MSASLVGSEMCIRDRLLRRVNAQIAPRALSTGARGAPVQMRTYFNTPHTVSYTHLTLPTICSV